jgi:hypothetical protein
MARLSKAQIGHCGELLVQLRLLQSGIESARLSTDAGIDLVAYSPIKAQPLTIQVKTNLKAKPAGGKGNPALDWWIDGNSPAQLAAFADLSHQHVWLFRLPELISLAQQHSGGKHHLYMYLERKGTLRIPWRFAYRDEFDEYLLENRVHDLFGI